MKRLQWLDTVRGIAALAVLIEHFLAVTFGWYDSWCRTTFHLGYGGVVAFLLVSGYIVPVTLEKSGTLSKFWLSRFFRLYPLYWVATGLAVIFAIAGHPSASDQGFTNNLAQNAAINTTMLQGFVNVPNALGVAWSLNVEMGFYLILSALFALGLHRYSLACAWVALTIVAVMAATGIGMETSLAVCWLTPYVGVLFYRWQKGDLKLGAVLGVYGAALLLIGLSALHAAPTGTMLGALAGYLFFGACIATKISNKALAWLGQVSYSVYMLHVFVVFSLPMLRAKVHVLENTWLSGLLAVAVTLGLSALCFAYLENPMIAKGKRIIARLDVEPGAKVADDGRPLPGTASPVVDQQG